MTQYTDQKKYSEDIITSFPNQFLIDSFEPKTGLDQDVAVLTFPIDNKEIAIRIGLYIKQSGLQLLDVEVSPSPENRDHYLLFVEMQRDSNIFNNVSAFLEIIQNMSGKKHWRFKTPQMESYVAWNETHCINEVLQKHDPKNDGNQKNEHVEITKLDHQDIKNQHQNVKLKNFITKSVLNLESLKREIQDLNSIKKNLNQHFTNMKKVRKQLYKQLELFKQQEEISLRRAEQDYNRIKELENRILQIHRSEINNTRAFANASNTPELSDESDLTFIKKNE